MACARHFSIQSRVYYEDTDAGGIVYHANYLRWMERARTEWLRSLGAHHVELAQRDAIQFVVSSLEIRYLRPARLDDLLRIDLTVAQARKASLVLDQRVFLIEGESVGAKNPVLTEASVRVAVMNRITSRAAALPPWLTRLLESR